MRHVLVNVQDTAADVVLALVAGHLTQKKLLVNNSDGQDVVIEIFSRLATPDESKQYPTVKKKTRGKAKKKTKKK